MFTDLRPIWDAVDGESIRREANAKVDDLWASSVLSSWSDVEHIIEQHVPHPGLEEGLEAAHFDIVDDGDDDGDDADGDDDSPGGHDSGADGPGGGGAAPGKIDAAPAWGGLCDDAKYLGALELVAEVAKQTRNDSFLRAVLKELRKSRRKDACSKAPEAEQLRRTAREERERAAALREARREAERQAALEDVDARKALEDARKGATIARREALEAAANIRNAEVERRQDAARTRQHARWLQTEYPVRLAERLLTWRRSLSAEEVAALTDTVRKVLETQRCLRTAHVPALWEDDKTVTVVLGDVRLPGGRRVPVRCSKDFEWTLVGGAWAHEARNPEVGWALLKLLDRIVPQGASMFRRRYTAQLLLESNDFVAQKAFVHSVILLSK